MHVCPSSRNTCLIFTHPHTLTTSTHLYVLRPSSPARPPLAEIHRQRRRGRRGPRLGGALARARVPPQGAQCACQLGYATCCLWVSVWVWVGGWVGGWVDGEWGMSVGVGARVRVRVGVDVGVRVFQMHRYSVGNHTAAKINCNLLAEMTPPPMFCPLTQRSLIFHYTCFVDWSSVTTSKHLHSLSGRFRRQFARAFVQS
jgi:hypothetical protein